ncbi:hypothetical protein AX16_007705 [Volvariella volvacea WC 439]|nr:hypothetical protein AX16_007705 [Volvariella volvacea WC 439]
MPRLPPELLLIILEELFPRSKDFGLWAFPEPNSPAEKNYLTDTKFLATLRLVSLQWYQVVTPSLYATVVLTIDHNSGWCLRGLNVFETYSHFIRYLVIKCPNAQDYRTRSTTSRFKDADVLEQCLQKCTNLRTLHLIDPEDLFFRMTAARGLRLFQACRQSLTNLESLVVGRRGADYPIYSLSKILLGLGTELCRGLSNLEVSCWKTYSDRERSARWCKLPACLPNISRLVLKYGWSFPLAYFNLLSRIYRESRDPHGGRSRKQKTTPLRELVIQSSFCEPKLHWATQVFTINNLGASLSVLEIQSSPFPFNHDKLVTHSDYAQAPLEILKLCPYLTVFRYFVPCPLSVFEHLPRTLRELGIRVIICADPVYLMYLPSTTITTFEPLADFVRSDDLRRDVNRIVVDVRRHKLFNGAPVNGIPETRMESWMSLKSTCSERGVDVEILDA